MLIRPHFGSEGLAYVWRYLAANRGFGKLIGAELLTSQDIDEGLAWAFVPAEPRPERREPLEDFESGGLYPASDFYERGNAPRRAGQAVVGRCHLEARCWDRHGEAEQPRKGSRSTVD